ncbi:Bre5p [Kluyveromyces lactis]|uniref:KLLA0C18799p n=1 Tax=Kluyveromyces lactis (strain ATCC 8585 / CBS 2359 / DSM 70799 / NBRC 1267 / NRRL Y-1140 / WM37) TaxID=284590 RepID=Q6CSQ1_KLULA|nr:uncharacterized protein KLLA0_C18799g [Kluyveromyces lactis]CAH01889.1 KLLA0C18799p [Kluyveromyces lactis]|eukprot:XP_453038.1 uncharacterized protein KLLA0_C18799g [Kluyveromyces lactis]
MTTYDVKEIGYAFLRTYYERMHNDPSKLSCLYSTTAELTHVNYNEPIKHDKDYLNTVKLIGKDNINNFFTRNSKRVQDLKVKIDSCDVQSTGYESSSILILILGELCWTDSPSYRFCQCFILEPAEYNSKVYDLKNDIIRFIPDLAPLVNPDQPVSPPSAVVVEAENEKPNVNGDAAPVSVPVSVSPVVVKAAAKPVEIVKPIPTEKQQPSTAPTETKVEQPQAVSVNKTKPKENEAIAPATAPAAIAEKEKEDKEDEAQAQPKEQATSASATPTSTTTRSESVPPQEVPETEVTPKAEPVKMTWAGKLNKTSKLTTNYIKVDLPQKKSKSPPPNGFTKSNKKSKQQSKPIGDVIIQNSSGFYPVYVGNTNGLTASELERALIKEYGDVVKTSFQDSFAVVDFREKPARDAAIDAQHLKVGERVINLNPKGDKASKYKAKNNSNNSNSNSGNTNHNTNGNSSHNSPSPELSLNQGNSTLKKSSVKSRNDKSKN